MTDFGELRDYEIFKAGKHTASDGSTRTWSVQDLDQIINNYDPKYHEAPVVKGHPATNGPAHGWVKSLRRDGDTLIATMDIHPDFASELSQEFFKKRSSSIYNNLDGKGLYLRHVGFLGAMPPAVKALADNTTNLSDADDCVCVEFSQEANKMIFSEWFKSFKKTVAEMPEEIPTGEITPLQFSEEEVAARELAAKEATKAELQAEFAETARQAEEAAKAEAHKATLRAKVDTLTASGKFLPAWEKAGLVQFLEGLAYAEDALVEFSEGEKQSPYEFMLNFLEGLPKLINFEEVAIKATDPGTADRTAAVAMAEYCEKNPNATYEELKTVASQFKE